MPAGRFDGADVRCRKVTPVGWYISGETAELHFAQEQPDAR